MGISMILFLFFLGCRGEDSAEKLIPENMVFIPAGAFIMGNNDGDPDEIPAHKVYLDEYYIGKYEVTVDEYGRFLDATGYRQPTNWMDAKVESHWPVSGVSWIDAGKYCEWLSEETGLQYRLPTEAEWEKAARGEEGYIYPWGDFWDPSRCNSLMTFETRFLRPIGSFPIGVSSYGVHDMAGNVWEWCSDWYDPLYFNYSKERNPEGPFDGQLKVARGGCWNDNSRYCRSTDRWPVEMTFREPYVGFRVCLSDIVAEKNNKK